MSKHMVYDLPVRIFHWLFAGLFIAAVFIAKTIDDDSPVFSYHMLSGLLLVFIVTLRIIWGFVGAKHSRFSSFALHPQDLISYFKGILSGKRRKWAGHNPASSWAALTMLAVTIGLGITGVLMSRGYEETFEDVHELLANAFLLVVLLHISGVILHSLRHRDGMAFTMIHGHKNDISPAESISHSKPMAALIFILLTALFAALLANNFNTQKRELVLFGNVLQLGEAEKSEENKKSDEHEKANREEEGDEETEND